MAKHIIAMYADLVDEGDADGHQLVAELHALFNPEVPSSLRALPLPLMAQPNSRLQRRWARAMLVGALAIFALVGATYVALPLLQSLWSGDRGLQHVTQAGLARELDLTQTVDGVTIHVQKGYADANRVAVGYSVEFPPTAAGDHTPQLGVPILTDSSGNKYSPFGSMFTGESSLGAQVVMFETP